MYQTNFVIPKRGGVVSIRILISWDRRYFTKYAEERRQTLLILQPATRSAASHTFCHKKYSGLLVDRLFVNYKQQKQQQKVSYIVYRYHPYHHHVGNEHEHDRCRTIRLEGPCWDAASGFLFGTYIHFR